MEDKRWHRPSLVGPVILIFAGLVLLASNLGIVRFDLWELWRLWPLLLILFGLDILGRSGRWASAVAALLALAAIGGAFYLLVLSSKPARPLFASQELVVKPVNGELGGAKQVDVTLRLGLGELHLGALSDSERLFEGHLDYPQRWDAPYVSYRVNGERGQLLVESRGRQAWAFPFLGSPVGENWTLEFNRGVPLTFDVDAGVSSSTLDLSRLRLNELRVKAGVGRLVILFPPEGERMSALIEGGVGEVVLRIPEELAARLRTEGGLCSVQVDGRFHRSGDRYETPEYGSSSNCLDVVVKGGVGLVRVE